MFFSGNNKSVVYYFDISKVRSKESKFFDPFEKGHFYRLINPNTLNDALDIISNSKRIIEKYRSVSNRINTLFFNGKFNVNYTLTESDVFSVVNVYSMLVYLLDSFLIFYSSPEKSFSEVESFFRSVSSKVLEAYDLSLRVLELYLSMPFSDFEKRTFLDSVTLSVRMNPFLDFSLYGSIDESLRVPFNSEDYRGYLDVYIGNLKLYYDIIKYN